MTMEQRNLQVEIRQQEGKEGLQVSGIVNTPGEKSQLLRSKGRQFYEIVAKGTFEKAIKNAKEILFLDSHNKSKILASTKNGSLSLIETEEGVQMEAEIVNTSYGRDVYELISAGLIGNMSFGFNCIKDSWSRDSEGVLVRTLEDIRLSEVSCVRVPAYEDSSIDTRGLEVENVDFPIIENEDEERDNEPKNENPDLYEFKNEAGEVIGSFEIREHQSVTGESSDAELFIYNEIGNERWEAWFGATVPHQIIQMVDRLRKCRNIDIRINSPGGSVFGGFAIANLLKTIPGNTTAYVDGICASIATVIALACDRVVIPSNCLFMIHPPSAGCRGKASDMRATADLLDKIEEGLLDIYMASAKENVSRETIKDLVDKETYLSGTEAAQYFNMEVVGVSVEARALEVSPLEVSEFDLQAFEERAVGEEPVDNNEGESQVEGDEDESIIENPSDDFDDTALKNLLAEIKEKRGNIE